MGLQINNYSTRNIFIWNNRYNSRTETYTNSTGSAATLLAGTVMGRVAATKLIVPLLSTATDGSQIPIGVLAATYIVADTASQQITYCIGGDVDANALVFSNGTDTLATEISLTDSGSSTVKIGTIGDLLINVGINAVASGEMTYQDNQ